MKEDTECPTCHFKDCFIVLNVSDKVRLFCVHCYEEFLVDKNKWE